MLSFFKSQQPPVFFAFILFFFVVKIPLFFSVNLLPFEGVHNFWGSAGVLFSGSLSLNFLLAQLCIMTQAVWFNYLFHKADYHEGNSMIPALYFVLVSSLIPQFNLFTVYTITGFLLLGMFQLFLLITIKENSRPECFNAGVLGGILLLLNLHFVLFLPFLFIILYAIKPFRLNEYLLLFFGILFPVYIAMSVSYFLDLEINYGNFSVSQSRIAALFINIPDSVNLIYTIAYVLFSFISLRGIMYSTGFKRRKNLNMLIFFFTGLVTIVVFSGKTDKSIFSLLFIPVSIFLTLLMLRIRKKRIGEILNVIFVLVTFITNIVRILK